MGLMKRIATERQMGNSTVAITDTVELPERPAHCTRTRLKPGIDGCGCEFCEAIDGPYMNAEPPEDSPPLVLRADGWSAMTLG